MSRKSIHLTYNFLVTQLLTRIKAFMRLLILAQKVLSTCHGWVSAENQRVGVIHVITNTNQKMIHSVMKEKCMKTKESLGEDFVSEP
jgi:hypothetical protein